MRQPVQQLVLAKRLFFGEQRDDLARAVKAMRASATPQNKPFIREACAKVLVMQQRYELQTLERLTSGALLN